MGKRMWLNDFIINELISGRYKVKSAKELRRYMKEVDFLPNDEKKDDLVMVLNKGVRGTNRTKPRNKNREKMIAETKFKNRGVKGHSQKR